MQEFTRKIGQNRGKPRLWIEGKNLVAAGLDHGNRWDLVPTTDGFDIIRNANGTRKIAGKPGRPIVDISGEKSLGVVATVENVKITYEINSGKMKVTKQ